MKKFLDFIKRNKKKAIVVAVIIVALLIISIIKKKSTPSGPMISQSETTTLAKKDLISSVNESGVVKAESSMEIFAAKPLPIREVYVKVGDKVKKGDVIAKLDDSTIRQQLAQKQAAIKSTNISAGTQIKGAKDKLSEAKRNKAEGTNAAMQSANNAVVSAYDAWQAAEKTYLDYKKSIEEGYNDQIIASQTSQDGLISSINTAELTKEQSIQKRSETFDKISENENKADDAKDDVRRYERKVREIQDEIEDLSTEAELNNEGKPVINQSDLNDLNRKLSKAQKDLAQAEADKSKYESIAEESRNAIDSLDKEIEQTSLAAKNAKSSLESNLLQDGASKRNRQDVLATYKKASESAHNSYIAALENVKTTSVSVDDEIRALENGVQSANASADNTINAVDLKYLNEDLADTVIKAPTDGTITELSAEVGVTPSAALAKVETLSTIQIESHVKEFDVNKVKVGMKVEVTSDALNKGDVFEGKVISVEPTPEKKAQGSTTNEVYYKTKIELTSKNIEKLKPGMNVRVKYILEENKNVFAVPSTAIYEKGSKKFVLGIKKSAGTSTIKEYEVKTGSENDIETIITGDNVCDKLIVVNTPEDYSNGMEINLVDSADMK